VFSDRRSGPGQAWRPGQALFLFLALLLTSCGRQAAQPRRIAVLRFENLSADPSADWMGRAFSEIISSRLSGAPGLQTVSTQRIHGYDRLLGVRPISAPGISAESTQAFAAGASSIAYGEYWLRGGKLEVRLTIEDPRSLKMVKVISASAPAHDVLGAAALLAGQLSNSLKPYGTRNPEALKDYITALESTDGAVMEVGLNLAIGLDPDFVPPYRLLAQVRAQRQDQAGAMAALEQALARGQNIPEIERARLMLQAAELRGAPADRHSALAAIVKLDPGDATAWHALAESALNRHEYRQSMQAFQKALALEPADTALLNLLGYAAAYSGELETGMGALRRYQAARPNEANPLDSMGDINLVSGRFAEAEDFYLQAAQKDPDFLNGGELLKAAMAHLMTADVAGADAIARRYFDARTAAKDPVVEYRRAQWAWISGRRRPAILQMEAFARGLETGPLREVGSRAYAEFAMWNLMVGDRAAAAQMAQKAIALSGPSSVSNAMVARFLALPPASSTEWVVRAEQQFPAPGQTGIKNFALAYALLVNREFPAAGLLLKQMRESGNPTPDEGLPVMLAWSYLETGRVKEAAPLLRWNPSLSDAGLTPFTPFYLPRLFYLRGLLAEKEGRRDAARGEYQKFLKLSGPDFLIWGEEKKVKTERATNEHE
jgi:tetratricopeptide (TPR) repeat protein